MNDKQKEAVKKEKFEVTELEEKMLDEVDGGADVNFGCNSGCGKEALQAL